ncbi:alkaline phosphatase family protein [Pseudogracilibacillus sp. SE30717A]
MLYVLIIIIIVLAIIFLISALKPANQSLEQKQVTETQDPVILLMIDSLMDKPLQQAIKAGRAPAFKYLIEQGYYYPNIVSGYPTMSVTIDSSILTGTYSDKHRVPGLVWYDEKEKRHVNYGSAREEVLKSGIKNVVEDTLYHLNHTHLSRDVKTIHEELTMKGLESASINTLIYRGNEKMTLNLLKVLSKLNVMPESLKIETPMLFSYGALAQFSPTNNKNTQLWERLGFNDKFTAQELIYIIQNGKLPAFTIAYFPDLDQSVHKNGPINHIDAIEKTDKQLQEVLNTYESWDEALHSAIWIVMGDSGQAEVGKDKSKSLIYLNEILDSYKIHRITEPVKNDDQIVLAYNERMAFIYNIDKNIALEEIVKQLRQDDRINLIAWKSDSDVNVVTSGQEGKLTFRPNGDFKDQYGQSWFLTGEYSVLDLSVNNHHIEYDTYPDALARLHSSLNSHSGNYIIVDAKPGFEFAGDGTPIHPGGAAHGSIHKQDSLIPMIVVGTETKPEHLRIVDLYSWFLQLVNK